MIQPKLYIAIVLSWKMLTGLELMRLKTDFKQVLTEKQNHITS